MTSALPASTPSIILGTNVLGWNVDEPSSQTILDAAVERGLTAIDTADVYSHWASGNTGGESETIIGNWMKARGNRARVQIHTKGGAPGAPGDLAGGNATAAYLTKAVDASLKRLGTDYIDLYYLHYDDKVTPPEETLGAFQRMIDAGKVRAIGGSNYDAPRLTSIMETAQRLNLPRYSVLQTHYNLADRQVFEGELKAVCDKHDLGVMAYFALAEGFLTGKYRTPDDAAKSKARGGSATEYLNPRGLRILGALDAVAAAHGGNCAQVALAWLIAKPRVRAIASATSVAQLDNLKAAMALKLKAADMATLDNASREG
jgi:aryl-alcohol dehydrogenase-like predicted oxidoreductase